MKKFLLASLFALILPCVAIFVGCGKKEFSIKVDSEITGGVVTVSANSAKSGTEISVVATPNEGYNMVAGSLKYNDIAIENNTFSMPNKDVVVTAKFEENDRVSGGGSYVYFGKFISEKDTLVAITFTSGTSFKVTDHNNGKIQEIVGSYTVDDDKTISMTYRKNDKDIKLKGRVAGLTLSISQETVPQTIMNFSFSKDVELNKGVYEVSKVKIDGVEVDASQTWNGNNDKFELRTLTFDNSDNLKFFPSRGTGDYKYKCFGNYLFLYETTMHDQCSEYIKIDSNSKFEHFGIYTGESVTSTTFELRERYSIEKNGVYFTEAVDNRDAIYRKGDVVGYEFLDGNQYKEYSLNSATGAPVIKYGTYTLSGNEIALSSSGTLKIVKDAVLSQTNSAIFAWRFKSNVSPIEREYSVEKVFLDDVVQNTTDYADAIATLSENKLVIEKGTQVKYQGQFVKVGRFMVVNDGSYIEAESFTRICVYEFLSNGSIRKLVLELKEERR